MKEQPDTPKTDKGKGEKPKSLPIPTQDTEKSKEIGGRGGLDPVRYGDWEIGGKCVDF